MNDSPPVIYDMGSDEPRAATQDDFDQMHRAIAILGSFFYQAKELIDRTEHALRTGREPAIAAASPRDTETDRTGR